MKKQLVWILFLLLPVTTWAQEGESAEPDINDFVYVDSPPQPVNMRELREAIGYPQEAVDQNIQGTVIARILLDENGRYMKHNIIKSPDTILTLAVEGQLPKLVTTPARLEGKALKYWVNIPFPFKIVEEDVDPRETAVAYYTQIIEGDSADHIVFFNRGLQFKDLRKYEEAIEDFNKSIAINPLNQVITPEIEEQPVKKKKKKKKDKEAEIAAMAAKKAKDDSLRRQAQIYHFYSLFARGSSYGMLEEYGNGKADMTAAIALAASIENPDSNVVATIPNAYMERGFMEAQQQNYDAAIKDYTWITENSEELKCATYQLIADIRLAENNYPLIVEAYNDLVACNPGDELLLYSRGYYKTEAGALEAAVEDLSYVGDKSINTNLRLAAYNRLGWTYLQMKQYDNAIDAIDKALNVNVLNPMANYYKGMALIAKGDNKEEACKVFKRALDYGIEGAEKAEVEALIQTNCGE